MNKNIEKKILEENMKYKLIFFIVLTIFSYFFIFKNILFVKKEKINLNLLKTKKEESFLRKEKLEKQIDNFKIEKNSFQEEKKEANNFFIYENSSVFKIEFEKKLNKHGFEYIESSRLEKKTISGDNESFYEVKIYYEIIGKIRELKKLFFLSEEEFYRFERENFIINFNEKNENVKLKAKVILFSYEKEIETNDMNSNISLEKIKKIDSQKIKIITLKSTNYCILQLENKSNKILKKENRNIESEKKLCNE